MSGKLDRRDFLKFGTLGTVSVGLLNKVSYGAAAAADAPNVMIIFPDQWRKSAIEIWQEEPYRSALETDVSDPVITPNLNTFCKESIVSTGAVSNYPLCSPMRGMFLSGAYPRQNGLNTNCRNDHPEIELSPDMICMPQVFYNSGYNTSYFGKCHWYGTRPEFDTDFVWVGAAGTNHVNTDNPKVYDSFVPPGAHRFGIEYLVQLISDGHFQSKMYIDDNSDSAPVSRILNTPTFSTTVEADKILEYLNKDNGVSYYDDSNPFFMMWAPNPPHPAYDGPDDIKALHYDAMMDAELLNRPNVPKSYSALSLEAVREYYTMVTAVDIEMGRIFDHLAATDDPRNPGHKLKENTIVIITADHGEMLDSFDSKGKGKINRESYDIPYLVRWPAKISNRVDTLPINTVDTFPTVCGLAGIASQIPATVQGTDLSAYFLDSNTPVTRNTEATIFMRDIWNIDPAKNKEVRGVRNEKYSFFFNKIEPLGTYTDLAPFSSYTLYDDSADPYQQNKLSFADIPVADLIKLRRDLYDVMAEANDKILENNGYREFIIYPDSPDLNVVSAFDFGLVSGTTVTKIIEVENIAIGSLTITSVTFSGSDAGAYSAGVFPVSLTLGEKGNIEIIFTANAGVGTYNDATAIITYGSGETREVSLTTEKTPENGDGNEDEFVDTSLIKKGKVKTLVLRNRGVDGKFVYRIKDNSNINNVTIKVYTTPGIRIDISKISIEPDNNDGFALIWDLKDSVGGKLKHGTYVVQIKEGDNIIRMPVVIVN